MEDSLIDSQHTRTSVAHDLSEAQALNGLMGTLKRVLKIMRLLFQMAITLMLNQRKNKHTIKLFNMPTTSLMVQINLLLIKVISLEHHKQ